MSARPQSLGLPPTLRTLRAGLLLGLALSVGLVACPKDDSGDGAGSVGAGTDTAAAPVARRDVAERIVILGFDGVDPDIIEEYWAEGLLPNLKALADSGHFGPLGSTNPPQSPVAWSSFASGRHPGSHGIFDFVGRDPARYLPRVGAGSNSDGSFDAAGARVAPPSAINNRNGQSFWERASQDGVPVRVLNVPFAFPVDDIPHGEHHAGLGVPDLRGTNSTCYFFSTRYGENPPRAGGTRSVGFSWGAQGSTTLPVEGPSIDQQSQGRRRPTTDVSFARADGGVIISAGGREEQVAAEGWSDWFELSFELPGQEVAQAAVRFHVIEAGDDTTIYMYPLNYHWDEPYVALSEPRDYSGRLRQSYGGYKTVGWVHDTSALNSEQLPDAAFLDDVWRTMEWRRQMTLGELASNEAPLFVSVFTAPDRVSHMFYRLRDRQHPRHDPALLAQLGDPIRESYVRMDTIVGEVVAALPENALFLIMSDHGFHSFRRGLHVNRWLVDNGYLVLKTGETCSDNGFFADVDWSQTRAYALGTGQIYVNLLGREGQGIVRFGSDYDALVAELKEKLMTLQDGTTPVFTSIWKGRETYTGARAAGAPDLQLGFSTNYQTSWATKLGGVPCGGGLFEDNPKLWSGDHAASDPAETAGILFANRPVTAADPNIVDFAPTVLQHLGVQFPPADYEGSAWFGAGAAGVQGSPGEESPAGQE